MSDYTFLPLPLLLSHFDFFLAYFIAYLTTDAYASLYATTVVKVFIHISGKLKWAALKECLDGIQKNVGENKVSLANITQSNVSIQNDILQMRGHIMQKFVAENRDLRSPVRTVETR